MTQENRVSRWFKGPEFLYQPTNFWPEKVTGIDIPVDDPEIKQEIKVNVITLKAEEIYFKQLTLEYQIGISKSVCLLLCLNSLKGVKRKTSRLQ